MSAQVAYLVVIGVVLGVMLLKHLSLAPFLFQCLAYQLRNLTHLSWFFSSNDKPVGRLKKINIIRLFSKKKVLSDPDWYFRIHETK